MLTMINWVVMLFSIVTSCTRAFVAAKPNKHTSMVRLLRMSGGKIPDKEELKPFYALGISMAKQVGGELKNILSKEELEVMLSGYSDEILDGTTIDARTFLGQYGPAISEILQKRSNALVIEQKKKGDDYAASFLLKNPKAMRAPSGLIYNEVLAGIGAKPTGSSTVKVHYHGTLIDGTVFDSSVNRGEPITFPLQNVIKGWQEGVQMMSTGGKATLVIPSDLAYGDNGSPPVIPPGATLQFDVELLEVS